MRIAEVMTHKVETIAPTATTADEARLHINAQNIRHLVVTQGKRIVGAVSDGDWGRSRAPSRRS